MSSAPLMLIRLMSISSNKLFSNLLVCGLTMTQELEMDVPIFWIQEVACGILAQ